MNEQLNLWIYRCPHCEGMCKINHSPEESVGGWLITIRCPHCYEEYPAIQDNYVVIKEGEIT